ncbi:hypothetical protein QIS99_18580 [Streptomyces sp. B-S-A8]|uniref:Transposase (putative) YhgA-like domain-containing protein n=1 Tax=Streptomyces solicavernae TaxID=3043614 RepID=A0ABT6RVI0_9ACTN|nr:hypothetical protein [Streptomyces sp. B-S-A8]MDI3388194.1 hypothetical protein [Streptomyces sp. B-S-A8]
MVTSSHEAMHRIFQHDPGLFSRVSQFLGADIPRPVGATALPTDLTEDSPVERRVDTLLRFDTAEQGPFLLAVEAQGKKDPAKPASWAYYASYLWTKYRLPTALLVVCQDLTTAKWARQPMTCGPARIPTLTLQPLVAGPHNMPMITDPDEAREDLVLASLAAITHAADPGVDAILKALSAALKDAPDDVANPIVEFTAQGLGNRPAKHFWRNLVAVDLSFYRSYLAEEVREEVRDAVREEVRDAVREEVREEVRVEVREEVRVEELNEGRAQALLQVLEDRGLDVSDDVRERITTCHDGDQLSEWLTRALTAQQAADIFDAQA